MLKLAEDIPTIGPDASAFRARTVVWNGSQGADGMRSIPEETAIALTFNGTTHAVMMATPDDLEDFAYGFSLTEGQIETPDQIRSVDISVEDKGIDVRIWLDGSATRQFLDRRRRIAGPTGCGLCGVESLADAVPVPKPVSGSNSFPAETILAAQQALFDAQTLHAETSAVHAAGYWEPGAGLVEIREDVGRHNALDKLAGALARQGRPARDGIILLTSRVSVEMVQKAAAMGTPVLVAVSAPTALAVRTAEAAGITIVAVARNNAFEVFSHADRVVL